MQKISTTIAEMDHDERAALPCIGRDRADLVVAGAMLLPVLAHRVLRNFEATRINTSLRGTVVFLFR